MNDISHIGFINLLTKKTWLLLAAIIVSLSTIVSVLQPLVASAAINYSEQERSSRLTSWEYARLIAWCYHGNYGVETDSDKVSKGQIFYNGLSSAVYIFSPIKSITDKISDFGQDYTYTCGGSDGRLTKDAFQALKINPVDFVCEMGYKRDNAEKDCKAGTDSRFAGWGGIDGGENRTNKAISTIKKMTGIDINKPGDDINYLFARSIVVNVCTTGSSGANNASGNLRYELKDIVDGKEQTLVYSGGKSKNDYVLSTLFDMGAQTKLYGAPEGLNNGYTTCGQALNSANAYFGLYKNILESEAVEQVCRDMGYRNISASPYGSYELTACENGFKNRDDFTYCSQTYAPKTMQFQGVTIQNPQDKERDACLAGSGIDPETMASAIDSSDTGYSANESVDDSATSCNIDGIGWIVCPVLTFLGGIADVSFKFLESGFLATNPNLLTDGGSDNGAYVAWTYMRNIANIAFVLVFLIIIFSQLTNFGLSNYGLKKMLPKLVIAAILVNISFFICQLAIDISNILGKSAYDIFASIPTGGSDVIDGSDHGGGWAVLITTLLVSGVGLVFAISVPVLLAALLAILMIALILVLRIALIILLTVISPLAFVAYLLPNTEHLFKKWAKTYSSLLLVYPIIGVVFGASSLASGILNNVGASAANSDAGGVGDPLMLQVIAMGVAMIPLFVVPGLLRNSLNSIGGIGAKLSSMGAKANSSIGAKSRETSMLSAINRSRQQGSTLRRARVQGKLARVIPGRAGRRLEATGAAAAQKIRSEEISDAEQQITSLGLTQDQRHELAMGNSVRTSSGATISGKGAVREAAVKIQGQTGNHDQIMSMVNAKMGGDLSRTLASSLATRSDKPAWLGAGALERVSTGDQSVTAEGLMAEAINNNAYSAEKIAIGDKDELLAISNIAATSSAVSPTGRIQIRDNAITALTDPVLSTKISKNKPGVDAISRI